MSSLPTNQSGSKMAAGGQPAKVMSSRLATMKFMQRASASQPSSPSTPDGPSAKRQRLSQGSYKSTQPSTPRTGAQAGTPIVGSEEQKRNATVEREGLERGETKWYLSFNEPKANKQDSPFRIVQAGFSALDAAGSSRDAEVEEVLDHRSGRRSFGKFNKTLEKQQNPDLSSSDSDSDGEDESEDDDDVDQDDDDPTGANTMIREARKEAADKIRAERKAKRKAEKAQAARLAEERRKRQVKLNSTTTPSSVSMNTAKNVDCHRCGEKGHFKSDCPNEPRQRKPPRMSY